MGKFIAFMGPVGVGKSTVIKYLYLYLRGKGYRVNTTFIKAYHGPAYLLWRFTMILLRIPKYSRVSLAGVFPPWFIIPKLGYVRVAKLLVIISALLDSFFSIPFKLLKILLLRKLGFVIFSEEYIYSTLFDYIYIKHNLSINNKLLSFLMRILLLLLNKYTPDVTVLLLASGNYLLTRWRIRGYADPQRIYILAQLPCYEVIFNSLSGISVIKINTDDLGPAKVSAIIINKIFDFK